MKYILRTINFIDFFIALADITSILYKYFMKIEIPYGHDFITESIMSLKVLRLLRIINLYKPIKLIIKALTKTFEEIAGIFFIMAILFLLCYLCSVEIFYNK
jgi:hypothetical protein